MSESPSGSNKIETATVDVSDVIEKGGHTSANVTINDLPAPPTLSMQSLPALPEPAPEPSPQPDASAADD